MLTNVKEYLQQMVIPLRLSGLATSGWPFVMSLWYVYLDNKIYLATIKTAKVVEYLTQNSRCAFEVASDIPPYYGVRGQVKAKIIASKGDEVLQILLKRYLGGTENPLAQKLINRNIPEVAIELTPKTVHQWNFTQRMANSVASPSVKVCP